MLTVILPLLGFWILFALSLRSEGYFQRLKAKAAKSWVLDGSGLLVQGWIFPLLQAYMLLPVLAYFLPAWEGKLRIPFWAGALLSFAAVDYLYYWNHRLLHVKSLWPWHRAHHSAETMDIFVSSRNSFFTHFLICYVWVHSAMIYLLKDDGGYLLGIALTSALDLWRHSPLRPHSFFARALGWIFVLPGDHAWHHARASEGKNFGANFKLWDRMHDTWQQAPSGDFEVGDSSSLQWKHLILPIREA